MASHVFYSSLKNVYDKWDSQKAARKEAGMKFHYYWRRLHWVRSHILYFFIGVTVATFFLIGIPNIPSSLIYVVQFGAPFILLSVLLYYSYMVRLHYRRWGGFDDDNGGLKPSTPPSGGKSPVAFGK
jgi:hypothetical protein